MVECTPNNYYHLFAHEMIPPLSSSGYDHLNLLSARNWITRCYALMINVLPHLPHTAMAAKGGFDLINFTLILIQIHPRLIKGDLINIYMKIGYIVLMGAFDDSGETDFRTAQIGMVRGRYSYCTQQRGAGSPSQSKNVSMVLRLSSWGSHCASSGISRLVRCAVCTTRATE